MWKYLGLVWVVACVVWLATLAGADVWDENVNQDDGPGTDNVLAHGVLQTHDLARVAPAPPDEDWYRIRMEGRSSYEVIVDNATGDLGLAPGDVIRLAQDGSTVLQSSRLVNEVISMRWESLIPNTVPNLVRVTSAACGTGCTAADRYRIRAYETTYGVPRFNNSGTQSTILMVAAARPPHQGIATFGCGIHLHFYGSDGSFLATESLGLIFPQMRVFNSADNPALQGQSGWVVVTHTCGYGGLTGKAVALEPATGFTFDTPFVALGL